MDDEGGVDNEEGKVNEGEVNEVEEVVVSEVLYRLLPMGGSQKVA